jgi:hypothetical protein
MSIIHKYNIYKSLKSRKKETGELYKVIVKENIKSRDFILNTFFLGIESYRNGLDAAAIFYFGLSVDLGLRVKLKEHNKMGALPSKFGGLIERLKNTSINNILSIDNKDETIQKFSDVEDLRNIYIHPDNFLYYLYKQSEADLLLYEPLANENPTKDKTITKIDNYFKEWYTERKAIYDELSPYKDLALENVSLTTKNNEFIQKRISKFNSFITYKYDIIHRPLNEKNRIKIWEKAEHERRLAKTLSNGDPLGLYGYTRFDAREQMVWCFELLQSLNYFKKKYLLLDTHIFDEIDEIKVIQLDR